MRGFLIIYASSCATLAIQTRMSVTISHTTRTYPTLPFKAMKEAILGATYELSLTFVGEKRAQTLNKQYRNKEYIPNVLSFPLNTQTGEIYITPKVAEKEAYRFSLSPKGYIGYLFIHGLLHLKGYPHGATMDRLEKKYCTLFKLK